MSLQEHLIHPLVHTGTSQTERLLAALLPDALRLDDRSMQDLIVAAYRYAGLLHYYNEDNVVDGDWRCFWEVETLTFLAVLAELDTEVILQEFNELEIGFAEDIDEGAGGPFDPGGEEITNYYDQITYIHQLAQQIQQALSDLPTDVNLRREIAAFIDKRSVFDGDNLVDALHRLIAIHKEAYHDEHGQALPYSFYSDFFGTTWGLADSNAYDAIKFEADYDRATVRALFRLFYEVLVKIRQRAQHWFDRLIEEPNLHQPHVALFLTFLRLFRHAQNSLNSLTGRQLNYYYEQVLCLQRRTAVADEVYLIFELAKGFDEHLVETDTGLLAGKDANGRPLIYKTVDQWVVRNAQLATVHNTHFDLCTFQGSGCILANPDTAVAYTDGAIDPTGEVVSYRGMGDNQHLPQGRVGFAVASPQLILREGLRIIDVMLTFANDPAPDFTGFTAGHFNLKLSSSEEWSQPVLDESITLGNFSGSNLEGRSRYHLFFDPADATTDTAATLTIRVVLEKDEVPIDTLGEDLATAAGFTTRWPLLLVELADMDTTATQPLTPDATAYRYEQMRDWQLDQLSIEVDVRDIRENLIVQNDYGVFDGTQKFLPFGPTPEIGNQFYIGSTEVFQKALDELIVDFEWINPFNFSEHYAVYAASGELDQPLTPPALEVEFIDNATGRDASAPPRIVRSGNQTGTTISGQVTDIDSNPLSNVTIEANLIEGDVVVDTRTVQTNAAGEYTLSNIGSDWIIEVFYRDADGNDVLEPILQENGMDILIGNNRFFDFTLYPLKVVTSGPYTGAITGRILNAASAKPLENFALFVHDLTNNEEIPVPTNDGQFTLNNPISTRLIVRYLDGDNTTVGEVHLDIPLYPELVIQLPQLVVSAAPGSSGVFAGTVLSIDDTDQPVAEVEVRGLDVEGNPVSGTSTDSDGNFTLESGSGIVAAELLSGSARPLRIPLVGDSSVTVQYFRKAAIVTADLTGQVDAFAGIPLPGGQLDFTAGTFQRAIPIDGDGSFTAVGLPLDRGDFTVRVLDADATELRVLTGAEVTQHLTAELVLFPVEVTTDAPFADTETTGDITVNFSDANSSPVTGTVAIGTNEFAFSSDGSSAVTFTGVNIENDIIVKLDIGGATRNIDTGRNATVNIAFDETSASSTPASPDNVLTGSVSEQPFSDDLGEFSWPIGGSADTIVYPHTGRLSIDTSAATGTDQLVFRHLYSRPVTVGVSGPSHVQVNLQPYEVSQVLSGSVRDIYDLDLNDAVIQRGMTGLYDTIEGAAYRILLPTDAPYNLLFELSNYEHTEVNNDTWAMYSVIDVRLFEELNLFPLIEQDESLRNTFAINIDSLNLTRDTRTQDFDRYSPTLRRGFINLTLQRGDFLHQEYQNVLIRQTLKLQDDSANETIELPLPPYTPSTNGISLSYKSRQDIVFDEGRRNDIDQYYYLLPFGGHKYTPLDDRVDHKWLVHPYTPHRRAAHAHFATGNLYLGLENLEPGTNLSLLFQLEEGSERKAEWQPPQLVWSYLTADNTWTAFESTDVLLDTTFGLTRSGLVRLKIPKTAVAENTMLDPTLHWLRIAAVEDRAASPPRSVRALPSIVAIYAQAVIARFADDQNDLAHLADPLPEGTISKLATSRTAVKKVTQPFDSYGGALPENGNEFYRRISERLRHRDRAVTVWDYERLLLEAFSKVHRVKCLPHTRMIASSDNCSTIPGEIEDTPDLSLAAPGYVLLAVIPDLTQRTATAQAEPRFSFGDLLAMEAYLRTKTNLFVAWDQAKQSWLEDCPPANLADQPDKHLWVVNPRYEPIRLWFKVAFRSGFDETFYTHQLDTELRNYLAPWLTDPAAEIRFGQQLYQSQLIAFIESRAYVDAIADFRLYQAPATYRLDDTDSGEIDPDCLIDGDRVIPFTPRSVLTTYGKADKDPDDTDHRIEPISKDTICPPTTGGRTNPTGA